jgi:hypothetical protein
MTPPLVSVLMPSFNAVPYLAEAIESILGQTYRDFEFLILDDESTDGSLEIARHYAARVSRIAVIEGDHRGHTYWLNHALKIARGAYIARMDADDVSISRIARQVEFLERNPSCVAVGCDLITMDSEGEAVGTVRHPTAHEEIEGQIIGGRLGVVVHAAAVMRRDALLSIGGYRVECEPAEDLDLWIRLCGVGQLANVPELLFKVRQHVASVCFSQFGKQRAIGLTILNEARTERGLPPLAPDRLPNDASPARAHRMWARGALLLGHRRTAWKHIRLAVKLKPFDVSAYLLALACLAPTSVLTTAKRLARPAWRPDTLP